MMLNISAVADIVAMTTVVTLLIVCFGFFVLYKIRYQKAMSEITQLTIDKSAMLEEIDRLHFIQENSVDIENGFIKFLSETRESAYSYIEEVQTIIVQLKNAMDNNESDEVIADLYEQLMSFVPEEEVGKE